MTSQGKERGTVSLSLLLRLPYRRERLHVGNSRLKARLTERCAVMGSWRVCYMPTVVPAPCRVVWKPLGARHTYGLALNALYHPSSLPLHFSVRQPSLLNPIDKNSLSFGSRTSPSCRAVILCGSSAQIRTPLPAACDPLPPEAWPDEENPDSHAPAQIASVVTKQGVA